MSSTEFVGPGGSNPILIPKSAARGMRASCRTRWHPDDRDADASGLVRHLP
jgi:hypothetical protein